MKKTLENQLSMCDMIPNNDASKTHDEQGLTCTAYNVCQTVEKAQENDLYPFVQWHEHNKDLLSRSIQGHHQSNVVEYNVQRAINTLSVSVDKCLLDSSKKIAGTARSVDRWRADLFLMLENVREENGRLEWSKQKIRKAQTALGVICSISVECLERRSFRLDTDLTLDPGQVELIKEKRLLAEVRDLMHDSLCRIEAQLKRNKLVKYKLEENWSDKSQSYKIDTINLGLNILSTDIMSHEDVVTVSENARLSVPEWEAAAKALREEAVRVLNESATLRSFVDNCVLEKSAKQLRNQADAVDIALARFISDSQQVERAIENDLKQVVNRLADSENSIGDLLRVITNLEKAKKTAETRLYNRQKRPENENVKDSAHLSLISEVKSLQEQLSTLNYQLSCSRTGHLGLQETRSQLEDEARIKRNTLWIDSIRCQNVRAHYPSLNILIGH